MKTKGQVCPPDHLFPADEKALLRITERNKAIPFLFHFIDCRFCRNRLQKSTLSTIKKSHKFTSLWSRLYREEKRILGVFCQKNKIKAVLIKDFSVFKKMRLHQQYLMGGDLDILVHKYNLPLVESFLKKRGYKLKKHLELKNKKNGVYYEERHYIHPRMHICFDLHLQLAIPHHDDFYFLSQEFIEEVSSEVLRHSITQKTTGLYIPDMEYMLLSLIIHHVSSNLLRGLRNLYDIIQFANLYDSQINWKRYFKIARNFQMQNSTFFIFLLGKSVFGSNIPPSLESLTRFPLRAKLLVPYWSAKKISLYPSTDIWNSRNKNVKNMFYEYFFVKILLSDSIAFSRYLRPRILFFISKVSLYWINRSVFRFYR